MSYKSNSEPLPANCFHSLTPSELTPSLYSTHLPTVLTLSAVPFSLQYSPSLQYPSLYSTHPLCNTLLSTVLTPSAVPFSLQYSPPTVLTPSAVPFSLQYSPPLQACMMSTLGFPFSVSTELNSAANCVEFQAGISALQFISQLQRILLQSS